MMRDNLEEENSAPIPDALGIAFLSSSDDEDAPMRRLLERDEEYSENAIEEGQAVIMDTGINVTSQEINNGLDELRSPDFISNPILDEAIHLKGQVVVQESSQIVADIVPLADGLSVAPGAATAPLSVDMSSINLTAEEECPDGGDDLDKLMFKLSQTPTKAAVTPSVPFSPPPMYSSMQPGSPFSPHFSVIESSKAWGAFGGSSTLAVTDETEEEEGNEGHVKADTRMLVTSDKGADNKLGSNRGAVLAEELGIEQERTQVFADEAPVSDGLSVAPGAATAPLSVDMSSINLAAEEECPDGGDDLDKLMFKLSQTPTKAAVTPSVPFSPPPMYSSMQPGSPFSPHFSVIESSKAWGAFGGSSTLAVTDETEEEEGNEGHVKADTRMLVTSDKGADNKLGSNRGAVLAEELGIEQERTQVFADEAPVSDGLSVAPGAATAPLSVDMSSINLAAEEECPDGGDDLDKLMFKLSQTPTKAAVTPSVPFSPPPMYSSMQPGSPFSPHFSVIESSKAWGAFGGSSTLAVTDETEEEEGNEGHVKADTRMLVTSDKGADNKLGSNRGAVLAEELGIEQERTQVFADEAPVSDGLSVAPGAATAPLSVDMSSINLAAEEECPDGGDDLDKLMFKLSQTPTKAAVTPSVPFSPPPMYSSMQPGSPFSPHFSVIESSKAWGAFGGSSTLAVADETEEEEGNEGHVKADSLSAITEDIAATVDKEDAELKGTPSNQTAAPDYPSEMPLQSAVAPIAPEPNSDSALDEQREDGDSKPDALLVQHVSVDTADTEAPIPAVPTPPETYFDSDTLNSTVVNIPPLDTTTLAVSDVIRIDVEEEVPDTFVSTFTFTRKSPFGYTRPAMSPLIAETAAVHLKKSRSLHLGGGACGMIAEELKEMGYEQHVGMWRGWPFDTWTCCNTATKVCPGNIAGVSGVKSLDSSASHSPWRGPNCSNSGSFARTSRTSESGRGSMEFTGPSSSSGGVTTMSSSSTYDNAVSGTYTTGISSSGTTRAVSTSPRFSSSRNHDTQSNEGDSSYSASTTGGRVAYRTRMASSTNTEMKGFQTAFCSVGGSLQSATGTSDRISYRRQKSSIYTSADTNATSVSDVNRETVRQSTYLTTTGSMSNRPKLSRSVSDPNTARVSVKGPSGKEVKQDSGVKPNSRNKDDTRPRGGSKARGVTSNSAFYSTLMKEVYVMAGEGLTLPTKREMAPLKASDSYLKTIQVTGKELRDVSKTRTEWISKGESNWGNGRTPGATQDSRAKTALQPAAPSAPSASYFDVSKSSRWKPASGFRGKSVPSPQISLDYRY